MSSKYEKFARVAASTLSAGSLAVFASRAEAQPDAVGQSSTPDLIQKGYEQAATHETAQRAEQTPQAFIDSFDKKLAKKVQLMHSSPYFSSIKHKQLSKAFHTEIIISYVGAPSKQYPGRYDWLAVAMRKGENVPLVVEVLVGSPSKSYTERINPKFSYLFGQVNESGKHLPKSMSILTDSGIGGPPVNTYFNVSSEGYPAPLLPEVGVKYSNDPTKVSAVYNAFLNQIQSIVTRK